jgi:hypothetical protein
LNNPFKSVKFEFGNNWNDYSKQRGKSPMYDLKDWMGGYPFNVAKSKEIIIFMKKNSFFPAKGPKISQGLGCNKFFFHRDTKTFK